MRKSAAKAFWGCMVVAWNCLSLSCNNGHAPPTDAGKASVADGNQLAALGYTLISVYPHDTTSYTEGLLIHDGELYESTGHDPSYPDTRSLFGVVDLKTGKIQPKVELDKDKYFGEGIVFLNGKVYQLTYKTRIGFEYDAKTFTKLREFTFPSDQGWGMTTDGVSLIMTDSTPDIHYLDPLSFKIVRMIKMTENKDYILKIDPANGRVVGKLDLSSLEREARNKYPGRGHPSLNQTNCL